MKVTLLAAAVFGLAASSGPNAQELAPAFEVTSVRPTSASTGFSLWNWSPARFTAKRVTVRTLIGMAYDVPDHLIGGGPSWARSEFFDIIATLPEGATPDERPLMLRGVLASRFGLLLHEETRDAQAYVLVMSHEDGRLGPGLTRPDEGADCERIIAERRANPGERWRLSEAGSLLRPGPICDSRQWHRPLPGGGGYQFAWEAGPQPIAALAEILSQRLKRPIIDRTGLTGDFDFRLEYVEPSLTAPSPGGEPNVFAALEEQLGLELESSRGPVTFLVIDALTRPDPN